MPTVHKPTLGRHQPQLGPPRRARAAAPFANARSRAANSSFRGRGYRAVLRNDRNPRCNAAAARSWRTLTPTSAVNPSLADICRANCPSRRLIGEGFSEDEALDDLLVRVSMRARERQRQTDFQ
jgi:hypothetical protein